MSLSKKLPLRAIFKVWRELGLSDNYEYSVISSNSEIFLLQDGNKPNTHFFVLNDGEAFKDFLIPTFENWRVVECCKKDCSVDKTVLKYSFKQGFPPRMRLKKNFKAKVKEWQRLPYVGPYEELGVEEIRRTKSRMMRMENVRIGDLEANGIGLHVI
ncbi:UNVERIFIED_CONTAM: hypothetical protein Sradi_7092300 [Sesamum radiatum]|uniref:PORR domain-containing protein n=1 Tax=Sesamum radiatum TaxID=300843 RepID=A0AAW2J3B1_SESRA